MNLFKWSLMTVLSLFTSINHFVRCGFIGLLFALAPIAQAQSPILNITRLKLPEGSEKLPEVSWRKPNDNNWRTEKPLFTFQSAKSSAKADCWLALTDSHILLAVAVKDPEHRQTKTGSEIWDGDVMRVGLDARGDGAGSMPRTTRASFGPDDLAFGVALTPKGPQGWVWSGPKGFSGQMPSDAVQVTRDEGNQLTDYLVRIPLQSLETKAGVFPLLGLAVQVNNHSSNSPKEEFTFGQGAGGTTPTPGLFEKFWIGNPPTELIGAAPLNEEVWQTGQEVTMQVAIASRRNLTLSASGVGQTKQLKIAPSQNGQIQRFLVSLVPKNNAKNAVLTTSVYGSNMSDALLTQQLDVVFPAATFQQLQARLDELIARPNQPELHLRHLRSVKALTQNEWAKVTIRPNNLPYARETVAHMAEILRGFQGDAAEWQTYLDGKRALITAYISSRDGTLQYYTFMLPKNWEADKKYPLFLELHGAGNPHALNTLAGHLGYGKTEVGFDGYSTPKTYAMIQRNGFHMMPWGRGNTGYEDIGETDVWEAYNDVKSKFAVDEDRQYLYGFSMGGAGTWVLGSRTPDLWAAIAIYGVGRSAADEVTPGIGRNVSNLPVWIWCGENDNAERMALSVRIRDEVAAYGNKPEFSVAKGVGHSYTGEVQVASLNWMQRHVRQRPLKFAYLSDTEAHTGAWGISMKREVHLAGTPSFSCEIQGQIVRIETKGTRQIEVDLGPQGLRMVGDVQVMVNGDKRYEGPIKKLDLAIALDDK